MKLAGGVGSCSFDSQKENLTTNRAFERNKNTAFGILILAVSAVAMHATAVGAAQATDVPKTQAIERELIPGADKMSPAEREVYRQRMQAAITPEEKANIRAGYAKIANERATSAQLVGDRTSSRI
jgi:hypothetical protein